MGELIANEGSAPGPHSRRPHAAGGVDIRLQAAPTTSAQAAGDLMTIKQGPIFVCSARNGDIGGGSSSGEGIYRDDTRFVSELRLAIEGDHLLPLAASAEPGFEGWVELTNTALVGRGEPVEQMSLSVRRRRVVSDRVYERIEARNHSQRPIDTELEVTVSCDFADIFEIRGVRERLSRGRLLDPEPSGDALRFGYIGEDGVHRETLVECSPEAVVTHTPGDSRKLSWHLRLDPGGESAVELAITPSPDRRPPPRRRFADAEAHSRRIDDAWKEGCTKFKAFHGSFDRFVEAGTRDLGVLRTPYGDHNIVVAGLPWYAAPFGRDAILTAYEALMLDPSLAREALLFLADRRSLEDDPLRDAEPGKILHELRVGELAGAGYVPHTPYYGSVDATPLFLMLAAAYHRWTGDVETLGLLRPAMDAALGWIDTFGDRDGDGFVEFERRSPAGLVNQGWKDSVDSMIHADGTPAEGPIAPVEVQGYVYLAKLRIAEVFATLGEPDRAEELVAQAEGLKRAFNDAFWMPESSTFALALDGSKRQVQSITSNPGHCLYCAIVDDDKADALAERLMADDMFSGWGIRTLSTTSPAYNPMSYHNGSVWPHDNAIIAAGLKRYGHADATERIALALIDAAMASGEARLPELYCGFRRRAGEGIVHYPVACRPQAWAAAVPFMIVQSMLGISANAPEGSLSVHRPRLPEWLGRLEIQDLRVGGSKVSLSFAREGDQTAFALLGRDGDIGVSLQA